MQLGKKIAGTRHDRPNEARATASAFAKYLLEQVSIKFVFVVSVAMLGSVCSASISTYRSSWVGFAKW